MERSAVEGVRITDKCQKPGNILTFSPSFDLLPKDLLEILLFFLYGRAECHIMYDIYHAMNKVGALGSSGVCSQGLHPGL